MKLGKNINNEYILADPLPSGYTETINMLDQIYGLDSLFKDYKYIREFIRPFGNVTDIIYNAYSNEIKFQLCVRKLVDLDKRKAFLGNDHDVWMQKFDEESYKSRIKRFGVAKSLLFRTVSEIDAFNINEILKLDSLQSDYITHGISGTFDFIPDPKEALFNFVDSNPENYYYTLSGDGITKIVKPQFIPLGISNIGGTIKDVFGNNVGKYANNGVRTRALTFIGTEITTNNQLANGLLKIIKDGEY